MDWKTTLCISRGFPAHCLWIPSHPTAHSPQPDSDPVVGSGVSHIHHPHLGSGTHRKVLWGPQGRGILPGEEATATSCLHLHGHEIDLFVYLFIYLCTFSSPARSETNPGASRGQ